MNNQNFSTTILVDQTPKEAFDAINNVRGWWSEEVEGGTEKFNDEFNYHYKDVHRCKMKLVEVVPEKKVVWLVLDNYFNFVEDNNEWTGTKISFDITRQGDKTQISFAHQGLIPEFECFDICSNAWSGYINNSLSSLIATGKGRNFTLEMVQRAVDMILGGAKFITTNRDPSPKKPGWNNLGIAATTAMIEEATGRKAFVTGKPSPVMMRSARKYLGLETAETTVVGDTMETDIQGGVQMGYKTILVLSGIARKEDLSHYAFKPDMVVSSVEEIAFPLKWWEKVEDEHEVLNSKA